MVNQETRNRRKNSIVVQGSILAAAAIIVRIIGLLYRIPLTRILTDEGAGYYSTAFNVYMLFLMLSSYGFPSAIAKIVAGKYALKKYQEAHEIFKSALWLGFLVGVVFSVLLYAFAPQFAKWYINEPNAVDAIRALAPAIFFYALLAVFRGYFQGMNTMMPTALSQIAEQILNAVFSLLLGYILVQQSFSMGAAGGTMGTGIGAAAGLFFMVFVYSITRNKVIYKRISRDEHNYNRMPLTYYWKMIFRVSVPIIIGTVILQLASIIDTTIFYNAMDFQGLDRIKANEYYGVYTMKVKVLIRLPITIAYALGAASLPSIANSLALKDYKVLNAKIISAIKSTLVILVPATIGMIVLARPVLSMLFGEQNLEIGTQALQLGAIAIVFNGLFTVTIAILQGLNKLRTQAIICLVGFGIKIILDFVFLYGFKMEINGLIWADNLFTLVLSILNMIAIKQVVTIKFDYKDLFLKPLIAAIVMGCLTGGVYLLVILVVNNEIIAVLIAVFLAITSYGFLILKLKGLSEREIIDFPKGLKLLKLLKKIHWM